MTKHICLLVFLSITAAASFAQAPVNDNACQAIALTPAATCTYQTFTNLNATASSGMAAPGCANFAGGDVWFKAVVPAGGALTFDMQQGSMTDGGMAIYRGGTCNALIRISCDDNSSTNTNMPKITVTGLVAGSTVYARVFSNGNTNNGTFGICVTIPVPAPVNDNPCSAIELIPGATCNFQTFTNESATATANEIDPGCAGYLGGDVWFKVVVPSIGALIFDTQVGTMTDAGMALYSGSACTAVLTLISCDDNSSTNANMPKLTVGSLTPGDTIWVRVWENGNNNNGTFGICATLPPPPPSNDGPCTAIELPVAASCTFQTFTNADATATPGVPAPGCANYLGGDVWFKVVVPAGGALTFDSQTGVMTDGGMAIYQGTCSGLTLINCDDDASANGAMPKITLGGLTSGDTLWVRFWENGNTNNGTFGVCVSIPPPAPANDDPCNAIELTPAATCTFQTFTNENATGSTGVPDPGCASYSGGDVWFRAVVPAGGALIFDTQSGVITDGGMAIYSGTCGNLALIQCDDDGGTGNMPKITAGGLTPGDTIWVRVWEFGNNGNGTFGICVTPPPPPPANDDPCNAVELPVGTTCTFQTFTNENSFGTAGVPAPGCAGYSGGDVWFKVIVPAGGALTFDTQQGVMTDGGMAIYSGTCNGLTLLSCDDNSSSSVNMPKITTGGLTPGDTIWIRVWENGNNNNGTFGICIKIPPPPPANDDPCNAVLLTVDATCTYQTFTNENATGSVGVPAPGCAGYSGGDVWFKVVVPAGGAIKFDTQTGAMLDGGMAIYRGTCTGLTLIQCDDNSSANGAMPLITAGGLTPGDTVWVRVWQNGNNNNGTFGICATLPPPPPANDNPCSATELIPAATCTFQIFTNENATNTPGVPAPGCASYSGGDVWFTVVVPPGGALTFDSQTGVITDGGMAIYSGSCNNLSLIDCNDDGSNNGLMSLITAGGLTPGDTIWVRFWEFGGDNNGTFGICVTIPPPAPANDNPCNAIELIPATTCTYQTFTNASALNTAGVPAPGCAGYAGSDVWFKVVVPAGGALVFDSQTGVMTDGGMAIYKGPCSSLTLLACDDDNSVNGNMPSITAGGLNPGDTIWVRMWENGNDNNGTFGICITIPPPGPSNDDPCNAITLVPAATCTYQTFTNAGAINTVGVPAPGCANYQGGDIWFQVTVPAEGGVIVDTHDAVMTDGGMALYTGTCNNLALVSCDDNNSVNGAMPTVYTTGLTPGTTAWIRVWSNGNNNNGTFGICITIPPPQPATLSLSCIKDTTIGCDNCFALTTVIPNIHSLSDDYVVNPLSGPGNCFRPYVGPQDVGPSTNLGEDDVYTDVINLPFTFPFYGKNYNTLLASTNGYLSFDTSLAGNFSHYAILNNGGFLSATAGTGQNLPSALFDKALIMGPYHDIDPFFTTSPDRKIKYNVTGIAPNRRWVLSFYKVPLYLTACQNLIENTHQIVLYEGSGMVEVFVFDKQICTGWNDGRAMIGMQDSARTRAIMAPGRRASDPRWGSVGMNESWRFVPVGGPTLFKRVELYDTTGNLIVTGDTSSIDIANLRVKFNNICPSIQRVGVTTYIVKTVYSQYNDPSLEVTSTDTIRVTRNAALNATYGITNAGCNQSNGGIVVTPVGTVPYTYSSNGGVTYQPDSSFLNLPAGTYHMVTKDGNNCTKDTTIIITAGSPAGAAYVITPATCNGANNGGLVINTTGNFGPYQYSVDGGVTYQPGNTFSLSAGTYSVRFKDVNGCTKDTSIQITEPAAIVPAAVVTAATCNGAATGTVVINQGGGTTPFEYSIDGGTTYQPGNTFTVAAGTFTIRIRDANGCTKDTTVTVTQPSAILSPAVITAVTCNAGNNGSIVINPSGGASPFEYSIDGGTTYQLGNTFTVAAGTFTIRIRDANGCTKDTTLDVTQPPAILSPAIITAVSCNAGNNGSIVINPSGGASPFEYSIDGGTVYQPGNTFAVAAGTFTIRIRDANGCTKDTTVAVTQPSAILSPAVITAVSCNGGSNGIIMINPSGGVSPYQYSSDGGNTYQPGNSFTVAAGTFTIRIKDANGCTKDTTLQVIEPAVITSTAVVTAAKCNGSTDGIIAITPSGGTSPYQYSSDGGTTYQPGSSFTVAAGTHVIRIKDANGCTKDTSVNVTQPVVLVATNATNNATCNPAPNGQITTTAIGGISPYSYVLDGGTVFQTGNSFTVGQGNSYVVTVKDANGCLTTAPAVVGFTFDLTLQGRRDTSICDNIGVRLNTISNAQSFSWSPTTGLDNSSIASPLASPTVTTNYEVTAQTGNCTLKDTVLVTVSPAPTVFAGNDANVVKGEDAQILASVTNAASYIWSPTTYLSNAGSLSPISVMPQETITYRLTATNSLGCSQYDEVTITVLPYCIKTKNAFTPNGDGVNDTWMVYDQYDCLKNVRVQVFNRYGSKVYESANYHNEWNGRYNGQSLPDATYYYVVDYTLVSGRVLQVRGDVTILR